MSRSKDLVFKQMVEDVETVTEHQAIDFLMKEKGEALSATGWEGYLAGGRGFMVSDGRDIGYFPACLTKYFPPALRKRVRRLVAAYQPEREVVALLSVPYAGT